MVLDVWTRRLRWAQYVFVGTTAAIATASILGWVFGTLPLASVSSIWVPMAPMTAVVFFALCATLIARIRLPYARVRGLVFGVASAACVVAGLELADFALDLPVAPDRLFVPQVALSTGVPSGRMSPVTAIAVIALSFAVAAFESGEPRVRRAGIAVSVLVAVGSSVLLVGYMYDAPLLYGGALVPVALPTATGLLLVGAGIALLGGPGSWPFALFIGESVRSRLMRAVLPVVMLATLAVAGLDALYQRLGYRQNPVLFSGVFIFTLALIAIVVLRSAAVIGRRLDVAEDTRRRAESERDEYRQHLETLVEERTRDLATANKAMRALNEQLAATNQELRAAMVVKNQFLANMSHELRTPLNSIIGFTGVLSQGLAGDLNEEQRTQVTMVRRSGERLLALINDMLDLSRIEEGRLEVDAQSVDLIDLVNGAADVIRPLVEQAGLQLILGEVPRHVLLWTDEQKAHQVLVNLLANAIKFTDAGHVSLHVRIPDADTVVFEVEDTGVGVAPEDLAAVFDEFVQISRDGAKPVGTGLGLAISRRIVTLLGGSLTAKSVISKGSTFVMTLPRVYRDPARAATSGRD